MTKGLTNSGFVPETYTDIAEGLFKNLSDKIGPLNEDDRSVIAQIINVFSLKLAEPWLALSEVFNNNFLDTARGIHLDAIGLSRNITRQTATKTIVEVIIKGLNQTIIPKDSEVSGSNIKCVFILDTDVILNNEKCYGIYVTVKDLSFDTYTITIDGDVITYTRQQGDTVNSILQGLKTNIKNSTLENTIVSVSEDLLLIRTSGYEYYIEVFVDSSLTIKEVEYYGDLVASVEGDIVIPANSLNIINTPIYGWNTVNNYIPGVTGRNIETDQELKARIYQSFDIIGNGTVQAITSKLGNIEGVSNVTVLTNDSDAIVNGLPPHSVKCVVLGGANQDIGDEIWKIKPAGIQFVGDITVVVKDSESNTHIVKFSRPINLYTYVNIRITRIESEYPIDGDSKIKQMVVDNINNLKLGEDVIYQSFYKYIYSIPGIENAIITIGGSIDGTIPVLISSNLEVGANQKTVTDLSKVTIVYT